jgi:hypothetical protein
MKTNPYLEAGFPGVDNDPARGRLRWAEALMALQRDGGGLPSSGAWDMSDVANQLAAETGVSGEQAHQGLGALLSFIKERLGDENFQKLEAAIPGAASMISKFESSEGSSQGGLFETVAALAGKLFGGKAGGGAELLASLSKLGFQPEQIETFLPKALEFLKSHLPPELIERVLASLPALANLTGSGAK